MNKYKRLSLNEREEISRLLALKCRSVEAKCRGQTSTWSTRAVKADRRAKRKASRRKLGKRKLLINSELKRYIVAKLKLYWSPEQIIQIAL